MRSTFVATLGLLVLFLAAAPARCGDAPRSLHVYTWKGYFSAEAVRLFEEKYNCRVDYDYYESNDTMSQKLANGGGYDIVTPTGNSMSQLARLDVLLPLDHSLLPNIVNIDPEAIVLAEDPDMRYGVPYTQTVTGVGYNRRLLPADAIGSWAIFGDARLAGKVTLLNDMRESIGAALKFLGHDINSLKPDEVRAAGDVVAEWKKNIVKFDMEGAVAGLLDGRYMAVQAYNGDIAHAMLDNPDIGFFVPEEGSSISADHMAICADAENPELAHAFINHFLDPEIAAANMNATSFYMPNEGAAEAARDFVARNPAFSVPDDIMDKCQVLLFLGPKSDIYDEVWTDVLLGD